MENISASEEDSEGSSIAVHFNRSFTLGRAKSPRFVKMYTVIELAWIRIGEILVGFFSA